MRRAAVLALVATLGTACGAPEPVVVPPDRIPFPLVRAQESEPPGVEQYSFTIALVRRRRLVNVERSLASSLPLPEIAVRTLLAGPNPDERERGLSTAIPLSTRLLSVEVFGGVAEVDLGQEFQAAAASLGFLLRVAQIATTLTGIEQVTAVRFSVDGEVAGVPIARGNTVQRPVTAADYAELVPRD